MVSEAKIREWEERIRQWRASGLTAREYARRNGFGESTLSMWVRKLAARSKPPPRSVALARVETQPGGEEAVPAVRLELPSGIAIRVDRETDLVFVRRVSLDAAVFVATEPVDMRWSFDILAGLVREQLDEEPRSGELFVFLSRRRDRAKILFFDKTGYCILYKRLDRGTFRRLELVEPGAKSV